MGLLRPPLPRPLEPSKRAVERQRNKQRKKSWKQKSQSGKAPKCTTRQLGGVEKDLAVRSCVVFCHVLLFRVDFFGFASSVFVGGSLGHLVFLVALWAILFSLMVALWAMLLLFVLLCRFFNGVMAFVAFLGHFCWAGQLVK